MWCSKSTGAVLLRPHHGMCLAYFEGKGYSEGFSAHMQEMLELFEKDVPVFLTVAADEICSACPDNEAGCCKSAAQVAEYDRDVLKLCDLKEGMEINFSDFVQIVQKQILSAGRRAEICRECRWDEICRNKRSRWQEE